MKTKDTQWINQILVNDEASSDKEIVSMFINELKISQEQAESLVSHRAAAFLKPMLFDITDYIK